jgi:DNA-binding CsgD family transcriptional regulator
MGSAGCVGVSTECSTAEMSERLLISPTTVRSPVSAVLHKLKVSDRDEATRLLYQEPGS